MNSDTITSAELLDLTHASSARSLEGLQELTKWDMLDPASYLPDLHDHHDHESTTKPEDEKEISNGPENGITTQPLRKRIRRGKQRKRPVPQEIQLPDEVQPPPPDEEDRGAKRLRLDSQDVQVVSSGLAVKSSPKPPVSDETNTRYQYGLIDGLVDSSQQLIINASQKRCEQICTVHQRLADLLQALDEPMKRLHIMQNDVKSIIHFHSDLQDIVTCLKGA